MAGLEEAFERIGLVVEHHLPLTHAAGLALAVTDDHDTLGAVVRGFAEVAGGRGSPPRDAVPDRVDLEVLGRALRAAGGSQGHAGPRRLDQRDPAVARAARAVRADHDARSPHPYERADDRRRARAVVAHRRAAGARLPGDDGARRAVLVFEPRLQAGRVRAGGRHRDADPRRPHRAPDRPAGVDRHGRRHHAGRARRRGGRVRAVAGRPARASQPSAGAGPVAALEHRRRLDRVDRARSVLPTPASC